MQFYFSKERKQLVHAALIILSRLLPKNVGLQVTRMEYTHLWSIKGKCILLRKPIKTLIQVPVFLTWVLGSVTTENEGGDGWKWRTVSENLLPGGDSLTLIRY